MAQPSRHSSVVGGSTANRVINCPGSVALCAAAPPRPPSEDAKRGTCNHEIISAVLGEDLTPADMLGMVVDGIVFDEEMLQEKIHPALDLLDQVDPDRTMEFQVESEVSFGDFIPDAFGSADLIGRMGNRAIVLDWKFGIGVPVEATENTQLMFYAAAARRTEGTAWALQGAEEIELIIIQPPSIKRWVTTHERLDRYEKELKAAVKLSQKKDAPLKEGSHCRWCSAKAQCPLMNGAMDRALKSDLSKVDVNQIGKALHQAELLEQFIKDLRALAHQALENGVEVPGWKLVQKRATRKWKDEEQAAIVLSEQFTEDELFKREFLSPAQMEKSLKKLKLEIPDGLVESVSSGTTIAPEEDPRPAALQIGEQLAKSLRRLV